MAALNTIATATILSVASDQILNLCNQWQNGTVSRNLIKCSVTRSKKVSIVLKYQLSPGEVVISTFVFHKHQLLIYWAPLCSPCL